MNTITIESSKKNYLDAITVTNLTTYSLEGYEGISNTIYIPDQSQNEKISLIRAKSHEQLNEGWSRLAKL